MRGGLGSQRTTLLEASPRVMFPGCGPCATRKVCSMVTSTELRGSLMFLNQECAFRTRNEGGHGISQESSLPGQPQPSSARGYILTAMKTLFHLFST